MREPDPHWTLLGETFNTQLRGQRAGVIVMMDQLARQEGAVRTVYHDQPNPAFQVCFALGLNAPRVPTRFFATMEEDLAWVKMTARGR